MVRIFLSITAGLLCIVATAAAEQPVSWQQKLWQLPSHAKITLPSIDRVALTKYYDKAYARNKARGSKSYDVYRFAEPHSGSYNLLTSGEWRISGDTAVWRLQFNGDTALGLNFGLQGVQLPANAQLYLYSPDRTQLYGPYTDQHNKTHRQLWTPVISGQVAIIELNVSVRQQTQAHLTVSKVNQSFRDHKTGLSGKSGACNINVICPEGDAWRDEIRSVARYSISGTGLCTGTLINNANNDMAPYFLTADHCGVTLATAASLVFYWNYEAPQCSVAGGGNLGASNSGARFISAWSGLGENDNGSDFTLVLMDDVPQVTPPVYWAGWDNSGSPYVGATVIHHPNGDEKSISVDRDPLIVTNYVQDIENPAARFLRVGAWDQGTTEPGSSGSGLWNSNSHLIGTLSGGEAACLSPSSSEDNDLPDWFGRLPSHWEGNGTPTTQLKRWLDPAGLGLTSHHGLEGCDQPSVSFTAPETATVGEALTFSATVSGGTAPYLYEWDFEGDGQTDSYTASPTHNYTAPLAAEVVLVVRANNCPRRVSKALLVVDENERFGKDGLFPNAFEAQGWGMAVADASEGIYSAQVDALSASESATMSVQGVYVDGEISFDMRISSEGGYDTLVFLVDNVEQQSWSGELNWQTVRFALPAGKHTLTWRYSKDGSVDAGADAVWIDDVQLPQQLPEFGGASGVGVWSLGVLLAWLLYRRRQTGKVC